MQITAGIRRSRSEPVGALFRRVQILHTRERLEKLDLTSSSSALRAKMKAEEEEVKEMTRPSLGLQNYAKVGLFPGRLSQAVESTNLTLLVCFIQELGHFLDRHDDAQLRRRKWQHLNWTYNVWLPLQKSVKQQVSRSRTTKEHQISRVKLLHPPHLDPTVLVGNVYKRLTTIFNVVFLDPVLFTCYIVTKAGLFIYH